MEGSDPQKLGGGALVLAKFVPGSGLRGNMEVRPDWRDMTLKNAVAGHSC